MYVCPKCKSALVGFTCSACSSQYELYGDIPCFLGSDPASTDQRLRQVYEDIYAHHTDVWVDQGRSLAFQSYFAHLVGDVSSVLEVGCGEGQLLAVISAPKKFGIDLSLHALRRARDRSSADCAIARCEQLPFPSGAFNAVVAVGVMEHFESLSAALAEIFRVLVPGGRYLALIQTDMTWQERLAVKMRQYVFPRLHPILLVRWFFKWLRKIALHPIVQPLRKSYSLPFIEAALTHTGFTMSQVISAATDPGAPLAGRHVVVLTAVKSLKSET